MFYLLSDDDNKKMMKAFVLSFLMIILMAERCFCKIHCFCFLWNPFVIHCHLQPIEQHLVQLILKVKKVSSCSTTSVSHLCVITHSKQKIDTWKDTWTKNKTSDEIILQAQTNTHANTVHLRSTMKV